MLFFNIYTRSHKLRFFDNIIYYLNMTSYSNSTPSNNVVFNGKGEVDAFIAKIELYNKLKKYEGEEEEAAALLPSRLEEPAFNVCLRLSSDEKKDFTKL